MGQGWPVTCNVCGELGYRRWWVTAYVLAACHRLRWGTTLHLSTWEGCPPEESAQEQA
jgi:hypothetical protein